MNYAIVVSTCAGLWSHVIGDTVRFESLDPPLLTFTGRTKYTLSAFGEHLISEEVEGAMALAADVTGASVREWHVGPVFHGATRPSRLHRRVRPRARRPRRASAAPSTPTSRAGTPTTWPTASTASACPCPRWSSPDPAGSTPGCGRGEARRPAQGPPDGQCGNLDGRDRCAAPREGAGRSGVVRRAVPGGDLPAHRLT